MPSLDALVYTLERRSKGASLIHVATTVAAFADRRGFGVNVSGYWDGDLDAVGLLLSRLGQGLLVYCSTHRHEPGMASFEIEAANGLDARTVLFPLQELCIDEALDYLATFITLPEDAPGHIPTPQPILELVELGIWPAYPSEQLHQNLEPRVPVDLISATTNGEEDRVVLEAPPFGRLSTWVGDDPDRFWRDFGQLDQIAPDSVLLLGDFGLGSDAPIISQIDPPHQVLRLSWKMPGQPTWMEWFPSAHEMASVFKASLAGLR